MEEVEVEDCTRSKTMGKRGLSPRITMQNFSFGKRARTDLASCKVFNRPRSSSYVDERNSNSNIVRSQNLLKSSLSSLRR